jgi:undecaprenyl diphosphate synthase|tara:strand:- start:1720 stop:2394 length:675 start_codon:yes stop_codon:yes gene_type:complete
MNELNHIAFIMDGNGRWGLKKKNNRNYGHLAGVKTVQKIVEASIFFKIPIISFYVFSKENWKRPKSEVNYLFNLINIYFEKEINNIIKNKIKIIITGKTQNLPSKIIKTLKTITRKTSDNKRLVVNLAINYGSKNEIIDAVKKINYNNQKITEEKITKNLYSNLVFPDILIRTGGQKRLSNFMLWQIAYTEIFFLDKMWPDFLKSDLKKIINKYYKIKRNFGGI